MRKKQAQARRQAATLALTAAALVIAACGGDGGGAGVSERSADSGERPAGSERADQRQIRRMLADLRADYNAGDPNGICSKLAAPGRSEIREFGEAMGHGTRCEPIMTAHFDRDDRTGVPPFDIVSIIVYPTRAVATATGGIAGRVPAKLRLIRHPDGWRIANPLSVSAYD